jgi:hypothetical protein
LSRDRGREADHRGCDESERDACAIHGVCIPTA